MKKSHKMIALVLILIGILVAGALILGKSLMTKTSPYDGIAGNVSISVNGEKVKSTAIHVKCLNHKIDSQESTDTNMKFYVKKCEKGPYDFAITVPGSDMKIPKYESRTFTHKIGCFVLSGEKCKLGVKINYLQKNHKWYSVVKVEVTEYNGNQSSCKNEKSFVIGNKSETEEVYVGP